MRRWFAVVVLLLSVLPARAAVVDARPGMPASLDVEGWVRDGDPRAFSPTDLYQYIDGAADLFKAYGLQGMATQAYQGPGGHKVAVDIYVMETPLDAFGVFSSERPPQAKAVKLGTDGYSESGMTAFWQGTCYVKASASDQSDAAAAEELARATIARIPRGTGHPAELKRLPAQGLVPGSEKYVRQSALGHKFLRKDVSGEYRLGKATGELHVLDLGTPAEAAQAWTTLQQFEAGADAEPKPVSGAGEGAFSAKDSSLGQFVAAHEGRFIVVGFSEKASRATVISLVRQGLVAARK